MLLVVLRLCHVMVASQHVVDVWQILYKYMIFVKTISPQAYKGSPALTRHCAVVVGGTLYMYSVPPTTKARVKITVYMNNGISIAMVRQTHTEYDTNTSQHRACSPTQLHTLPHTLLTSSTGQLTCMQITVNRPVLTAGIHNCMYVYTVINPN